MIRVLVVDKTRTVSEMIALKLSTEPDIEVIGTAMTVDEAMRQAPECDIVLASIILPNNGLFELTQTILKTHPAVRVLAIDLPKSAETIIRYIEAGVAGYVLKGASTDEILRSIRAAYSEQALVSPQVAAVLMSRITELARVRMGIGLKSREFNGLTPREREVLDLMGRGLSNQEIADHLVIEVGTAKNYVHSILKKLDVSSRQAAIAYLSVIKDTKAGQLLS